MGKKKRSHGSKKSDTFEQPDKRDDDYYMDDVEQFHSNRDKIMLDEGAKLAQDEEESEEEVLGLGGGSDSEAEDDEQIAEYEKRLRSINLSRFKEDRASDLSGEEGEEEDEPEDEGKNWGGKRAKFYGGDYVDDRKIEFNADDLDPQVLEAQEAEVMERRMAEQLDDADFDLDIFQTPAEVATGDTVAEVESEEVVTRDVTALSKRERLALLQQESPEMLTLIDDFKAKMEEAQTRLFPIREKVKDGSLTRSKGTDYVTAKLQLILNYCTNISFYMTLKAKRAPIQNHPVIKRLLQYRNLLQQMAPLDEMMTSEIDAMLDRIRSGRPLNVTAADSSDVTKKQDVMATYLRRKKEKQISAEKGETKKNKMKEKKISELLDSEGCAESEEEGMEGDGAADTSKVKKQARKRQRGEVAAGRYETAEEREALEFYEILRSGKRAKPAQKGQDGEESGEEDTEERPAHMDGQSDEGSAGEEDEDIGKRAITYQMATNKGLMPKRKREQRNPRVKNKLKFRKALIRRRGQVREARTEMTRYGGELSGIRAGVKKSTKFKS